MEHEGSLPFSQQPYILPTHPTLHPATFSYFETENEA